RNYYLFNRTTWLDSTIEHTGKAFLGLTMNCAKCHDHKYDPIEQLDYYRFRAVFEPHQVRLDPVPGVTDFEKDGLPRVYDDHLDAETFLHVRGDPANPDTTKALTPGVPSFLASFAPEITPVKLPTESWAPGSREYARADRLNEAREMIDAATQQLEEARSKLANAPKDAPAESKAPATPADGSIWLQDEFDRENPEQWEPLGEGWKFEKGQLIQTIASRDPNLLQSREPHPHDFELTCRYTTTGGTTYKSVTFRFDLSDDDQESNFVYTSAHQAGPKVQIAHTTGGKTEYPSDGRVAKPITVGQTYELRFAVRGQLINVWLDDEFLIAYRLPRRNPGGKLAVSAFDATASFDSIIVRALPADFELTTATAGAEKASESIEDLVASVKLAEARLHHAEDELEALEATIAADDAAISYAADATALAKTAAQKQAKSAQAKANVEVALHEKSGDAGKLKEAQKALQAAEKALAAGGASYQPLRAAKKALEAPTEKDEDTPAIFPESSSGRRTMLAQWITSRDNPLTARVAVNHVWLRHFGEPLVATVFDFGRQAPRPEHQELLDWLAAEFIESGWSFRHLHRLMVTSETYRLTSTAAGADRVTVEADPTNQFYWRMNPRRMESQVVRDSLLELSGNLDVTMGGPSLSPSKPSNRRSLYFLHSRDQQDKFLTMFDDADLLQCYRRSESIVPQQALALSNSALSLQQAAKIADHLNATDDENAFIEAAFAIVLARAPDESERAECRLYLEDLRKLAPEEKPESLDSRHRAQLIHALLNHNDFVTIR
ncbi:MAG: DUF1553 domain-containing protein, partial [Verrucomicrobiae bacterium]|nr:DUF1553 domain-containing protein [Verrucomicrobiae bacterium]